MNRATQQRPNQRRRPQQKRPAPPDPWRAPKPLPELTPIEPVDDVTALLRSLGEPPMNNGNAAGHYFASVIGRASLVARALALSADVLADPLPED
ncbi:MAG: hypothetical protein ACKVWR_17260 [Acidimicrobiales bacterium]